MVLKSLNANELKSSQSSGDEFIMSMLDASLQNEELKKQTSIRGRHFSVSNNHRLSFIQATPIGKSAVNGERRNSEAINPKPNLTPTLATSSLGSDEMSDLSSEKVTSH